MRPDIYDFISRRLQCLIVGLVPENAGNMTAHAEENLIRTAQRPSGKQVVCFGQAIHKYHIKGEPGQFLQRFNLFAGIVAVKGAGCGRGGKHIKQVVNFEYGLPEGSAAPEGRVEAVFLRDLIEKAESETGLINIDPASLEL